MKPFWTKTSCSTRRPRPSSTTASPRGSRSSTTTATCRRTRWPTITASARSTRSGSTATTTSGARCGPTASPSARSPARRPTGRSSRPGPRPSRTRCATRSTTGRTSSCGSRSACASCWGPTPRARSSTTATPSWRATTSPRRGCCASSTCGSCAAPTIRSTTSRRTAATRGARAAFTKLLPTWRPDRALALARFGGLERLARRAGRGRRRAVGTLDELRDALAKRHEAFHAAGCRASDHGLERHPRRRLHRARGRRPSSPRRAPARPPSPDEIEKLRVGAALRPGRDGSPARLGAAVPPGRAARHQQRAGWRRSAPTPATTPSPTSRRRSRWRASWTASTPTGQLAKTIVYNLNPADNEAFATVIGSFQDGSAPGKMQLGSAWWFLDQLDGMRKQIDALSNLGLLSRFVGMLTDSRSFLSFSRHEYFRRLLCNMLGAGRRARPPAERSLAAGRAGRGRLLPATRATTSSSKSELRGEPRPGARSRLLARHPRNTRDSAGPRRERPPSRRPRSAGRYLESPQMNYPARRLSPARNRWAERSVT